MYIDTHVDGCIWIGRGGGKGGGGGRQHERSRQSKEAWVGWVKRHSNWCRCLRSLIFC